MINSEVFDGDWRLLSHDPVTGAKSWWLDLGDGNAVIRTDTPVDELIDENAESYNDSLGQRFGDWTRVASIPLNVYHQHLREAHTQGDEKYVSKWLNDLDNQKFRTFRGRV